MRNLLFILTTIISFNCFAQDKIVKIPQSELDAFFLAVDTLEQQDSIKTLLITDLELQLDNFRTLNAKNESILLNKDQENSIHLKAFPKIPASWQNNVISDNWNKIIKIRNSFLIYQNYQIIFNFSKKY